MSAEALRAEADRIAARVAELAASLRGSPSTTWMRLKSAPDPVDMDRWVEFVQFIQGVATPYQPRDAQAVRRKDAASLRDPMRTDRQPGDGGRAGTSAGSGVRAASAYRDAADTTGPHRQPALLVEQIMTTPVISARPDDPIAHAARTFARHSFHYLPVIDERARPVGMISERDLLRADPRRRGLRVRDLMASGVLTATTDASIRSAARIMVEQRVGALPVVDPGHVIVGILTGTDILRCVVNEAPLDLWL